VHVAQRDGDARDGEGWRARWQRDGEYGVALGLDGLEGVAPREVEQDRADGLRLLTRGARDGLDGGGGEAVQVPAHTHSELDRATAQRGRGLG